MFAKDLEYLLAECCRESDVSPVDAADIAARFHSLRGYGSLPRGRENRARRLSTAEIAAAIFGLVPVNPKRAGHDLRPVGGAGASFHGAASLTAAVENLLTDRSAREGFLALTLSVAERFTNSSGSATLAYQEGEIRRRVPFVSKMAVSLLQPGAERSFEIDGLYAPVSRSVVFDRAFFDLVDTAVARSVAFPGPPEDGDEAKKWIAGNFGVVSASADDDPQLKAFLAVCGREAPEEYIYTACRHAVAHASIKRNKRPSDADDVEEIRRLHSAPYVLRLLARHMISQELGVSDQIYSGD